MTLPIWISAIPLAVDGLTLCPEVLEGHGVSTSPTRRGRTTLASESFANRRNRHKLSSEFGDAFQDVGRMMRALGQVIDRSHAKPFGNKTKLAESTDVCRRCSLSRAHGAEIRAG